MRALRIVVCAALVSVAALWVATDRPGPVHGPRDAVAAPVHAVASVRPAHTPIVPAVLVTAAGLILLAAWVHRASRAARPLPVPVRVRRSRGPPRSTSL
ncbi:MAG: hypothetical protein JO291_08335 [Acidimicrobiia bacterium]|nr:hypothetical protein [Acidimicrobiia bacterium]